MSLVAYEGSSDDDSSNEDMDTTENVTVMTPATSLSKGIGQSSNNSLIGPSSLGNVYKKENSFSEIKSDRNITEDEASVEDAISSRLKLDVVLPKPKKGGSNEMDSSLDVEIGPIPPKKLYGDEDKYLPPSKASSFQNLTTKKVQGVVKISIPSLKDFDEDDTTESGTKKIFQPSNKGSGLFAVLPPPRNSGVSLMTMVNESNRSGSSSSRNVPNDNISKSNVTTTAVKDNPKLVPPVKMPRSLVPDSVKQNMLGKRPAPSKLEEIRAKYLKQDANVRIVHSGKQASGSSKKSDDSDEDGDCDFFSLDAPSDLVNDPAVLEKLQLPTPSFEPKVVHTSNVSENSDDASYNEPSTSAPQEDVMKYVTKRQKGEAINFIEVNADDLRPDSTEWLKNITDESAVPARRSKGLGGLVKRKHQITYLAFEAKAREQELQNTWAQNRASRRQTQSKYGF